MIQHYVQQAWRSFRKHKTYSGLNILGLSAGLMCFAYIVLWVKEEWSFDRFHKKADRIVRLTGKAKTESGLAASAVSSAPMAAALKADYPEVENAVRMDMNNEAIVQYPEGTLLEKNILLTDPSFFDVFSFRLVKGNPATVLKEPYSLVLTESAAKKYFGSADPLGETV